jgi:hypothetical protein
MAINPNTDFSTGQVLTAGQQNRFPRGVMALVTSASNGTFSNTETAQLTTASFTALADRYYKITYFDPAVQTPAGAGNFTVSRLRITSVSGTQFASGQLQASGATQAANTLELVAVTPLPAGSVVLVASLQSNTGTQNAFRGAAFPAFLLVEDIGPA